MHPLPRTLHNTPAIELWPAWLLVARGNADARAIARGRWVLRRKRDGRYLAVAGHDGLRRLDHLPQQRHAWRQACDALAAVDAYRAPGQTLAMHGLRERLAQLGLDADAYAADTALALVPEPLRLALAGFDRWQRPLWLRADAARAWQRMQAAAAAEGIALDAISGYRSHDYQLGIFERKRARGLAIEEILAVNAAPGFSEHHSGRALDIGTPGEPPAEEAFEGTQAFAWLQAHAGLHGFAMSYPRGNPHGIVHEPWHWAYDPPHAAA